MHHRHSRGRHIHHAALALFGSLALLAGPAAQAQADKPPLRILVGVPPGGSADTIARLLSERLPGQLGGQTVVVDNMPGAAGRIAIDQLKTRHPMAMPCWCCPAGRWCCSRMCTAS